MDKSVVLYKSFKFYVLVFCYLGPSISLCGDLKIIFTNLFTNCFPSFCIRFFTPVVSFYLMQNELEIVCISYGH